MFVHNESKHHISDVVMIQYLSRHTVHQCNFGTEQIPSSGLQKPVQPEFPVFDTGTGPNYYKPWWFLFFTSHDGSSRSRKGGFCRKWNKWLGCTRDVAHTYNMWYIYDWYLHISYRWYRDTGIYNILEPWHRYISYIDDIYSRAIHISYIHNLYFNETHESTFTCSSSFYYVCCNKNHSRNVLTSHAKRGIYAC